MIEGQRADRTVQLADMVMRTEAALNELHHYYRLGRHLSLFPLKSYFLFSHCAHLLFSLWLAEQDSPTKVFAESPGLTLLFTRVDFGALRYADYSRRMLYANAYEEHLKNEPKWFKFWIRLLQELQGSDASGFEEFSQQFFACLGNCGSLGGRLPRRDQKALAGLVHGPRAGHLLLRSTWILEDVISTASAHIARLDPAACAIEQMRLLICLLSQLRRAIVWETTAKGPHTLTARCGWSEPSTLDRFLRRKTPGILTVTPGQESGEVTCTHAREVESKPCERTWVRSVAALPCPYEELLFKTWPHDTPKQSPDCETPAQAQAHWIVHALEAGHLETIARHVDTLLEGLGRCHAYDSFVQAVAHVLRNGQSEWTATELPWDYVRKVDQLITKLTFACREAKVLGGENPAEQVITNLWPPQYRPPQDIDATATDKPVAEESSSPQPQTQAEEQIVEIGVLEECEQATESQAPPVQAKSPEPADEPTPADHRSEDPELQTDLPDEIEPADIESLLQPACFARQDHVDQPLIQDEQDRAPQEKDRLTQLISLILGEDTEPHRAAFVAPTAFDCNHDGTHRESDDVANHWAVQSLVWRLLEWHRPVTEDSEREPLSLVQLQQDLGWSQSKVLQTMGDLFGGKPFTLYKQKCAEKSIRRYLEHFSSSRRKGSGTDAPMLSLGTR